MSPLTIILTVFIVLFLLRIPVAFALAAAALVGLMLSDVPIPLSTLPTAMWQGTNAFVLLAIPAFILLGNLAVAGSITRRLVELATAYVGHLRGGLVQVSIVTNIVMAGMSGSDLADASATGSMLIPAMKRAGYPVGYAAAIIAGAATMGPLIPPSISFVIFAAATDTSVGRLFLAGAIPGFVLGLSLMLQAYFVARVRNYPREPRMPFRARVGVTLNSLPVLAVPVCVLGSILMGIATPTESAVVGVLIVLLIGGLLYHDLTLGAVGRELISTLRTAAAVFFIMATAAAFARVLTLYGAADGLADWLTGLTTSPTVFLLGVNLVLGLLGCIVDSVPILLVFVPLMMPTVVKLGIDPVHFGVICVFNILIGLITPPYGLTMFLLCRIAGISFGEFWRHAWSIFLTMVLVLMVITFVPPLSTALPNLVMPLHR